MKKVDLGIARAGRRRRVGMTLVAASGLAAVVGISLAAQVLTNGDFTSDLSGWTLSFTKGSAAHDGSTGQPAGSATLPGIGRNAKVTGYLYQDTPSITAGSTVVLTFDYKKDWATTAPSSHTMYIEILKPDGTTTFRPWEHTAAVQGGAWTPIDTGNIGASFDQTGVYQIRLGANFQGGNNDSAEVHGWFDEVVLDVASPAGNDTVDTTGSTAVEVGPVDAGTSAVEMLYFDVAADGLGDGSMVLDSITVEDLGTGSAWDNLEIYLEPNTTFTGANLIGQVASWDGSLTSVTLDLGTRTLGTTAQYIFVVYDVAEAAENGSLRAQVTALGVDSPDNGVTGLDYQSNTVNVNVDTLSAGGNTTQASSATAGELNVVMQYFQVTSNTAGNNTVTLDSLTVEDVGGGTGAWDNLEVHLETGTSFTGTNLVGQIASWDGSLTPVTLNLGTRTVTNGTPKYLFIVYDINAGAAGETIQSQVTAVGVATPDTGASSFTFNSSSFTIDPAVTPDDLQTSAPTTLEVGPVDAGTSGVEMLQFQVSADGAGDGNLVLNSITVEDLGTGGAWDNLEIYLEPAASCCTNLVGQVASWDGTLTAVTLGSGDRAVGTTNEYLFVVYDVAESAENATLRAQVTAVGVDSPDNGVTGLDYQSNTVSVNVDTVTASNNNLQASSATAGQQNVVMQYFEVNSNTAGNNTVTLDSLTVEDIGGAAATTWDNLEIHLETGTTFTGTNLVGQVASWDGSLTSVTLNLGTRTVTNGTPKYVFIVYDLSAAAGGQTIQSQATAVGVASPDTGDSSFTFDSSSFTVSPAAGDTLSTSFPTPVQSGSISQGATGVVMLRFQVDSDFANDGNVELNSITVDDLGTAGTNDWTSLEIYIDSDLDFTGATKIGTLASWDGTSTAVALNQGTAADRTVTHLDPKWVFVVYNIAGAAATGATLQARVTALGVAGGDNGVSGLTYDSFTVSIVNNGTTPGTSTAQKSSCNQFTVTSLFSGDDNGDGTTLVEYGESSTGPWSTGCAAVGGPSPRQCLVTGLTPGINSYYFQITFSDPDDAPFTTDKIGPFDTGSCDGTDDSPPTLLVLSPSRDTIIGGTETVKVQVYDASGVAALTVEKSVDGDALVSSGVSVNANYNCDNQGETDNCKIYEFDIDTSGLGNGEHYLNVRATDGAGNVALLRSTFQVYNQGGSPGGSGLLLRRTKGSQLCIDCHNLPSHSSQLTGNQYGNWAVGCLDCHTPHRTRNIFLIEEDLQTPSSGSQTVQFHYVDAGGTNPGDLPGDDPNFLSFLGDRSAASNQPYSDGICEVCHTKTSFWRNNSSGDHAHNEDTRCLNCHAHDEGFKGSGSCLGCHGNSGDDGTIGPNNRRPLNPDFASNSHHVRTTGGASLTDFDCVVCHAEGDISNNEPTTTAYHENAIIDLKDADQAGVVYSYDKDAIDTDVTGRSGNASWWNSGNPVWRTETRDNLDPFCLSCHDSDGATAAKNQNTNEGCAAGGTDQNPFCDDLITNTYDGGDRIDVVDIDSMVNDDGGSFPPQGEFARHAIRGKSSSRYSSGTYIYDAGLFTNMQDQDSSTDIWKDTSVMGCADCHTTDGANTTAGNAHGSDSEYLLKDASGNATEGKWQKNPAVATYNCFRCHNSTRYADGSAHTGSDSNFIDTTGATGSTRAQGDGSLYGMTCTVCHGGFGWGTIHGTSQVIPIGENGGGVGGDSDRNAYRFMNGAGLRFFDPVSANWNDTSINCFTLSNSTTDSWGDCTQHNKGKSNWSKPLSRPLTY